MGRILRRCIFISIGCMALSFALRVFLGLNAWSAYKRRLPKVRDQVITIRGPVSDDSRQKVLYRALALRGPVSEGGPQRQIPKVRYQTQTLHGSVSEDGPQRQIPKVRYQTQTLRGPVSEGGPQRQIPKVRYQTQTLHGSVSEDGPQRQLQKVRDKTQTLRGPILDDDLQAKLQKVLYRALSLREPVSEDGPQRQLQKVRDRELTLRGPVSEGGPHNTGIPKRLHQIWTEGELIPEVFQDNIRGLVAHNMAPEWEYYFWTGTSGTALIKKTFPGLLKRYQSAAGLLKGDILRMVVLYQYGGAYFDLDTVSVKPLAPYMETHTCSLVTDPPEHVIEIDTPKPRLLITNSAMLCKPFKWFILHVIKQLEKQPTSCVDAIACTGPGFISRFYEYFQTTNKSSDLPLLDDYQFFEDKVDHNEQGPGLNKHCLEPFTKHKFEWSKEICRNWIRRGRENRNISEKAYSYHTWFHTYFSSRKGLLHSGVNKRITELVPHVKLYEVR